MLGESDPAHALLDFDRRRSADRDGATRPLRSAVYYFRLEVRVPENHLPRLIEMHISLEFVREPLKDNLPR